MTLAEAADELYALAPSDFVAARNTLASRTRKGGDREVAAEIAALPKPSAGAAAVNRLVREKRAELESLAALGERFRRAEEQRNREDVVQLTRERRKAIADLTGAVAGLNATAREELNQTLRAAVADAGAAAAVLSGRLLTGLSADGVQAVDVERAVAGSTPDPAPKQHVESSAAADRRRDAEKAEKAARDAENAWSDAKSDLADLQKRLESRTSSVADLTAKRDRLAREVEDAQGALDAALAKSNELEAKENEAASRERSTGAAAKKARAKADEHP